MGAAHFGPSISLAATSPSGRGCDLNFSWARCPPLLPLLLSLLMYAAGVTAKSPSLGGHLRSTKSLVSDLTAATLIVPAVLAPGAVLTAMARNDPTIDAASAIAPTAFSAATVATAVVAYHPASDPAGAIAPAALAADTVAAAATDSHSAAATTAAGAAAVTSPGVRWVHDTVVVVGITTEPAMAVSGIAEVTGGANARLTVPAGASCLAFWTACYS